MFRVLAFGGIQRLAHLTLSLSPLLWMHEKHERIYRASLSVRNMAHSVEEEIEKAHSKVTKQNDFRSLYTHGNAVMNIQFLPVNRAP